MSALNLPSASDVERLERRIRSFSQRLEDVEEQIDDLTRELGALRRKIAAKAGKRPENTEDDLTLDFRVRLWLRQPSRPVSGRATPSSSSPSPPAARRPRGPPPGRSPAPAPRAHSAAVCMSATSPPGLAWRRVGGCRMSTLATRPRLASSPSAARSAAASSGSGVGTGSPPRAGRRPRPASHPDQVAGPRARRRAPRRSRPAPPAAPPARPGRRGPGPRSARPSRSTGRSARDPRRSSPSSPTGRAHGSPSSAARSAPGRAPSPVRGRRRGSRLGGSPRSARSRRGIGRDPNRWFQRFVRRPGGPWTGSVEAGAAWDGRGFRPGRPGAELRAQPRVRSQKAATWLTAQVRTHSGGTGKGHGPLRPGTVGPRASRRRPGQAVAASETPGTGSFRGGSVTGTGGLVTRVHGPPG